jgi:hypothetical protein
MTDFDWSEFDNGGDYPEPFKFESIGDKIVGIVTKVRITTFGGTAERTPELWLDLDDGTARAVAASQARLKNLLAEHKPRVGDRIAIVYTGDGEKKPGKSAPKLFDVVVKRGDSAVAVGAPQTANDLIG